MAARELCNVRELAAKRFMREEDLLDVKWEGGRGAGPGGGGASCGGQDSSLGNQVRMSGEKQWGNTEEQCCRGMLLQTLAQVFTQPFCVGECCREIPL